MGPHFLSSLIADILGVKYDHFYDQRDQSSKGKKRKKKKKKEMGVGAFPVFFSSDLVVW